MNDQPQSPVDTENLAYANSAFGLGVTDQSDPVAVDHQGNPLPQDLSVSVAGLDLSEEDVKKLFAALSAVGNVQLMTEPEFAGALRDKLQLQADEKEKAEESADLASDKAEPEQGTDALSGAEVTPDTNSEVEQKSL